MKKRLVTSINKDLKFKKLKPDFSYKISEKIKENDPLLWNFITKATNHLFVALEISIDYEEKIYTIKIPKYIDEFGIYFSYSFEEVYGIFTTKLLRKEKLSIIKNLK